MYRTIKFLLVQTKPAIVISKIITMNCTPVGIESVVNDKGQLVVIDWLDTFLVEFTGNFDKQGQELFTGDIVEVIENTKDGAVTDLYLIGWSQGSFTASHLKDQNKGFLLSDQGAVMQTKKVGNQFENGNIIVEYLKPHADEKMEGSEGDISNQAQPNDTVAEADKK